MSRHDLRALFRNCGMVFSAAVHGAIFIAFILAGQAPELSITPPRILEVATVELGPATQTAEAPAAQTLPQAGSASSSQSQPAPAPQPDQPKKTDRPKPKPKPHAMRKPGPTQRPPEPVAEATRSSSTSLHHDAPTAAGSGQARNAPGTGTGGAGGARGGSGSQGGPTVGAQFRSAALHNPPTQYPPQGLARRLQGTVRLRVQVLPSGTAGVIQVEQSSGHSILDQSAVEQVRKWRFIPGHQGNKPVVSWVVVPVVFKIRL